MFPTDRLLGRLTGARLRQAVLQRAPISWPPALDKSGTCFFLKALLSAQLSVLLLFFVD